MDQRHIKYQEQKGRNDLLKTFVYKTSKEYFKWRNLNQEYTCSNEDILGLVN